jgi:hypothetical protein
MRKRNIIPAAGAIAAAAAIAIASTAGATATAAAAKNERFTFMTTSTTSPGTAYSVIATGAFIGGGTAKKTKTGLALTFPDGTITFDTKKGHKKIVPIMSGKACLQRSTKTGGSFTIAGGTGVYKGITGSGHVPTNSAMVVEQLVHGNCASNFSALQGIAIASGTVSLP